MAFFENSYDVKAPNTPTGREGTGLRSQRNLGPAASMTVLREQFEYRFAPILTISPADP